MYIRLLILFPILINAQNEDLICGVWLEEEKRSHIKIYKNDDGAYEGEIIWLAEPLNEFGEIKTDKKNPNTELRDQKIKGLTIIKNLQFNDNNNWSSGTIYDARTGKTYSLNAKLENNNTLFMRGYIGFSLIGKTTTWTRIKE